MRAAQKKELSAKICEMTNRDLFVPIAERRRSFSVVSVLGTPANPADEDAQLMLRVGAGEIENFAVLMNKHRPTVIHFIYRKVKNLAIAEELSQEVFLRVYRSRHSYRATARFRTWLFRVATNLTLNAIRDAKAELWQKRIGDEEPHLVRAQIADRRPSIEAALVAQVKFGEVREAIECLPPLQRSAVLMQRYWDMDYAAIACELGCSESAVKSLLFRAHEALRHRLAYLDPLERLAS